MVKRMLLFCAVLFSFSSLSAATYHTGTVYFASVTAANPHGCGDTLYDPEITVLPGGDLQMYGQGNNSSRYVDEVFGFRRNQSTGDWPVPAGNGVPAWQGQYTRCSYSPTTPGSLASPSIVKVGSTYYMAYSGGNADNITGRVYWATSTDGLTWTSLTVGAGTEGITPIIYGLYHDECTGLNGNSTASGVGQVELASDGGYFYFFLRYGHYANGVQQSPFGERIAFRINRDTAAPGDLGSTRQIYYNGAWTSNSGKFVWTYDNQSAYGTDQVLTPGHGTNMALGAGDVKLDPQLDAFTGGDWIHFYQSVAGQPIYWEWTGALSNGTWTYGGMVDLSTVTSAYPSATVYYPGLYFYHSELGGVTGSYVFLPIQDTCGGDFGGLRIISSSLSYY